LLSLIQLNPHVFFYLSVTLKKDVDFCRRCLQANVKVFQELFGWVQDMLVEEVVGIN
jgi:hypothetical protein